MNAAKKAAVAVLVVALRVVGVAFAAFAVTVNTSPPPEKVQATESESAAGAAWEAFKACTVVGEISSASQAKVTRGIVDKDVDPNTPWDLSATNDYAAQEISASERTATFTNIAGQRVVATLIDGPSRWWWYEADKQVARADVKTISQEAEDCSGKLDAYRDALSAAVAGGSGDGNGS